MTLFTSDRERRLWLWTLAVMAAIYSTLGLAPKLAGILRDRGLIDVAFFLCMLLIGAGIVIQGLKRRPGGAAIGIAMGIAAVYLMVFLRMASPEERTHLIEYSVVALVVYEGLLERAGNGRHVPKPALLAIGATTVFGGLDECIQSVLPSRVFDPIDILFNALAALMAVSATVVLAWAKRRFG